MTLKQGSSRLRGPRPTTGFTLLELLVVLVIVGLLATYVGPRYFDQLGKSERRAAQAQIAALEKALAAYRLDVGHFPSTAQGLVVLVERPAGVARWQGPYLSAAVPADPWGGSYSYEAPGPAGSDYLIRSLGRDQRIGGAGADADVSSAKQP